MKAGRWFPTLRAILTLGRELHGIRVQLTRLADHVEGKVTTVEAPPDLLDPVTVAYTQTEDYDKIYEIEQRLTRVLKREPTPEEIVAELDGVET